MAFRLAIRSLSGLTRPRVQPNTLRTPAGSQLRSIHAFRPTLTLLKAKKKAGQVELLDEDDPELLEAELLKEGERGLAQDITENRGTPAEDAEFVELYNVLVAETADARDLLKMPKHSRLNNLLHHVKTGDHAEKLPLLVEQWRNKRLPITPYTSTTLIDACCRTNRADVAFTLLADRQRYGLLATEADFTNVITALAPTHLDDAFVTLGLVARYQRKATGAMYAALLEGCAASGDEEALRKAALTAQELASKQEIKSDAQVKAALQKLAALEGDAEHLKTIQEVAASL